MLPDYPRAKEKLHKIQIDRFKSRAWKVTGPFAEIKRRKVFEGHRQRIERADGSVSDTPFKETAVKFKIDYKEMENMSFEDILKKLDDVAVEMGRKQSDMCFQVIDQCMRETGNIVDGKGKPFSIEQFFEVLEKMYIDFNPKGEPVLPTIVAGEKLMEKIKRVLPQLDTNPEYKKRFKEIIDNKREEWRVTENSRKLVG